MARWASEGGELTEPIRAPDSERAFGCPKRMVFGPCGGVRADGACEMAPRPCVFDDVVRWPGATTPGEPVDVPLVLTDFSAPPFDPDALSDVTRILASSCDAVLVGEHQDRPDFPPPVLARLLLAAGLTPWPTLACRDRNRIVLEQELHGLRHVGVRTVLCVTGDGRAYDVRPEVTQVFDLDGTRLASLAASLRLIAAVVETPTAPPHAVRPLRLVEKQRAGAGVAILNHVGAATELRRFMSAARAAGLAMPVIASVPVYTDPASAAALQGLPGLDLPASSVARVLAADDPVSAGVDAAVEEARAVLAVGGIAGVNISGSASSRGHIFAAEVKAEIGRRIRLEAER